MNAFNSEFNALIFCRHSRVSSTGEIGLLWTNSDTSLIVRCVIGLTPRSQIGLRAASTLQLSWCTAEIFPRKAFSNPLDLL
jgi:hypothetical protein